MSQRTTSHLRARELQLSRGGRVLLTGIDLTLVPGAVLAVVGENGRGKTTLLEALAGTLEPDAGTVERHGVLGVVRQELATADADGPRTGGDLLDACFSRYVSASAITTEAFSMASGFALTPLLTSASTCLRNSLSTVGVADSPGDAVAEGEEVSAGVFASSGSLELHPASARAPVSTTVVSKVRRFMITPFRQRLVRCWGGNSPGP